MSILALASLFLGVTAPAAAAQGAPDPRAGLKGGYDDAATASRGLELVARVKNPPGFSPSAEEEARDIAATPAGRTRMSLNFINTDLAFSRNRMAVGNFHGVNIYDIADPRAPKHLVSIVCPGGQNDVALYGNLLFVAYESKRARVDCGEVDPSVAVDPKRFSGVRIFDISKIEAPRQVAAIQTCQGAHTLTLVTDPRDRRNVYVYGSGTTSGHGPEFVRPAAELAFCSNRPPEEDPNTSLYSIDVIKVPLDAPEKAAIVSHPRVFADHGRINGLTQGGPQEGGQKSAPAVVCHDITVYPEKGLAAGACIGAGLLLDITDPVNPKRLDWITDKNFGTWHSATFSNDGGKVVFTDEWNGGAQARCQAGDPEFWGGDGVWTIENRKFVVQGYYKIPQVQSKLDSCASHNGNLIPVPGRDLLVQAWYQGGVSVMDFTDPKSPREIAFLDRGPYGDGAQVVLAGYWSSYWYNGYIYNTDIRRGFDVMKLVPTKDLTANEIAAAELVREQGANPQTQTSIAWPDKPVVARAYLDQLVRASAVTADRRAEIEGALAQLEKGKVKSGRFAGLAGALRVEAGKAAAQNAVRYAGIAHVLAP